MAGHINDHILDVVKPPDHINDGLYRFFGGGASPLDPDTTLFYDFAGSKSLIDDVNALQLNFTRSSSAWDYDSNGNLVEFPPNVPRFGHSLDGQSLGLGISEASENFQLHSQDMTQQGWAEVTGGVILSPTQVSLPVEGATVRRSNPGSHIVGEDVTYAISVTIWGTPGETVAIRVRDNGSGGATTQPTFILTAEPRRVNFLWSKANVVSNIVEVGLLRQSSNTADIVNAVDWQIERSDISSSPIITTTDPVTRTIEDCFTNDISWFNPIEGTLFCSSRNPIGSASSDIASIKGPSGLNPGAYITFLTTGFGVFMVRNGSGDIANLSTSGYNFDLVLNKIAGAYAEDDVRMAVNGTLSSVIEDGIPAATGFSQLVFGQPGINASKFNGYIEAFAYANVRKDDTFLQSVTQ